MPQATHSLTLPATIGSLSPITEFVAQGALAAHLPESHLSALALIMEEALMNVFRYAYPAGEPGHVTVTYSIPTDGELQVELLDQGHDFNPLTARGPNLHAALKNRPVGGLGIHLIKSLATTVKYRRQNGCNHLTFAISSPVGND